MTRKHSDYNIINMLSNHINNNEWDTIIDFTQSNILFDYNKYVNNGNNIFHYACIKGDVKIIDKLLNYIDNNKLSINIKLTNSDGISGLHLYYKFGGKEKKYLYRKELCYVDSHNNMLINYLFDNLDLLELFIEQITINQCIDNLSISSNGNYYVIYEILKRSIDYESISDFPSSNRYLNVVKSIYSITKNKNIGHIAIYLNSIKCIKYLIKENYNFNVNDNNDNSSIGLGIKMKRHIIVDLILNYIKSTGSNYDVYKSIQSTSKNYDALAIFVVIDNSDYKMMDILIKYIKLYFDEYEKKYKKIKLFDQTDTFQNTYLHYLLNNYDPNIISIDTLKFFIRHTDLNLQNYAGVTGIHMLINLGLWKLVKDVLKNKTINLLITDDNGNNSYSFLDNNDRLEFLEFTKTIKIPLQKHDNYLFSHLCKNNGSKCSDPIDKLLDHDNLSNKTKNRNYGLFNSNIIHYMLYLRYVENKHPHIFIPFTKFNKEEQERSIFFYDLTSYNTSHKQSLLNRHIKSYLKMFYSYLPHNIYWIDNNRYYINPKLIHILKKHNNTIPLNIQRFVLLKITLILDNTLHANALIYDRLNKTAWRFEPYGITDMSSGIDMDNILKLNLEKVYGKITYHDPDSYLTGLNFQLVDGEDDKTNHNLGDPNGYCLAWTMWFIDTTMSYPEIEIDKLLKNILVKKSVSQIISVEEKKNLKTTNYYLDFIRRYARKLDDKKNEILLSLGINIYDIYKLYPSDDVLITITNHFKL